MRIDSIAGGADGVLGRWTVKPAVGGRIAGVALWIGLDPVDRGDLGVKAATLLKSRAVVITAEPSPCNAHGNAKGIVAALPRGEHFSVAGAVHVDAEWPTSWLAERVCGRSTEDKRASVCGARDPGAAGGVGRASFECGAAGDPVRAMKGFQLDLKPQHIHDKTGPGSPTTSRDSAGSQQTWRTTSPGTQRVSRARADAPFAGHGGAEKSKIALCLNNEPSKP